MFDLQDLADFMEVPVESLNAVKVRVLASKAEALIRHVAGDLDEDTELWPDDVRDLGLSVVARALEQSAMSGVESTSVTAGPFSQSRNFSSDAGTVWLTKQEKLLLRGDTGGGAFMVDTMPKHAGSEYRAPDWWH